MKKRFAVVSGALATLSLVGAGTTFARIQSGVFADRDETQFIGCHSNVTPGIVKQDLASPMASTEKQNRTTWWAAPTTTAQTTRLCKITRKPRRPPPTSAVSVIWSKRTGCARASTTWPASG